MQLLLDVSTKCPLRLCYDFFVAVAGSLKGFKTGTWTLKVSTHKLIFFSCVGICHHIADTDARWTHLTFFCLFFPAPCPPCLWCNTPSGPLRHLATFGVCHSRKFVYKDGQNVVNKLQSNTHIYSEKKRGEALIFRSSVSDLIRVNKPQCGERNSMFSLLIGISRTFLCDIRGTESLFN